MSALIRKVEAIEGAVEMLSNKVKVLEIKNDDMKQNNDDQQQETLTLLEMVASQQHKIAELTSVVNTLTDTVESQQADINALKNEIF